MKLWLDDVREPWKHGAIGWKWVKTYEEAIKALENNEIEYASLDHDLSEQATLGQPTPEEKTGYDVVCWMEANNIWPTNGCDVHSFNPSGKMRMIQVLKKYGKFNPRKK